jgi:hypothetical protein
MISPRPAQSPRFRTQILYAVFSSPIFIGQRIDLISLLANLHLTETMPLPSGAGTDLDPCRSEDALKNAKSLGKLCRNKIEKRAHVCAELQTNYEEDRP